MPNRPRRLVSEHGPLAYTDRPSDPKHACECVRCINIAYPAAADALTYLFLAGVR